MAWYRDRSAAKPCEMSILNQSHEGGYRRIYSHYTIEHMQNSLHCQIGVRLYTSNHGQLYCNVDNHLNCWPFSIVCNTLPVQGKTTVIRGRFAALPSQFDVPRADPSSPYFAWSLKFTV